MLCLVSWNNWYSRWYRWRSRHCRCISKQQQVNWYLLVFCVLTCILCFSTGKKLVWT